MKISDQKFYWETKIVDWESSTYLENKGLSLLDRMAAPFRKILMKRLKVAEQLASKYIKGKVVLDLGCASGILITRLLRHNPKILIGVDIAEVAINIAKEQAKKNGLSSKIKFICADVRTNKDVLKEADVIIGVGFIDYFNAIELLELMKSLKGKKFLLSFPEKRLSPREVLHRIYLIFASCPGSYKYSKTEMDSIMRTAGIKDWWYYDKENIRFVTNLPRNVQNKN